MYQMLHSGQKLIYHGVNHFYKIASIIIHARQQDMDLPTYINKTTSLRKEFLSLITTTNGKEAQQKHTDKLIMVLTLIRLRPKPIFHRSYSH